MNYFITYYILLFLSPSFGNEKDAQKNNNQELISEVQITLEKGIEYFHSINIHGGYVYYYTLDLNERWHDDGIGDKHTIEIQPPGTTAVGISFLRAYKITKNQKYLKAAKDAARSLIIGQNDLGGWNHQVHFNKPKD
ncbi:MAG: pectic acid lyase, partial [Draconibacterium sp.]|nr:pectic acid lyase [Draconibacterium sp.]